MQLTDLNGTTLEPIGVACRGTQLTDWTEPSTRQPKRVIAEYGLSGPVIVLILNLIDELSDVNAGRACLLAWAVRALHTAVGLGHGLFLRVNSIVEASGPVVL